MDTIILNDPLDMHVHFREGEMLDLVAPMTAKLFSGALVMPNTSDPIMSVTQVMQYRAEVVEAVREHSFNPYMTLYFSTKYKPDFLEWAKTNITAIKFYSKGMTTNSHHGTDPEDPDILPVLEAMEGLKIPLCVHAEADGYWLDRESRFHQYLSMWARRYPDLKIIIEHVTHRDTLKLLERHDNLYATITPHHLLLTTDDFLGDTLRPHMFCKPLMKRPEDRDTLRNVAFGVTMRDLHVEYLKDRVMLGTDSAPHEKKNKLKDCGCAGVFTAPIALQLLAEEFHQHSTPEQFQKFVSDNAKRIYGITPPSKRIVLVRHPFDVPDGYISDIGPDNLITVIPLYAGQLLQWSVSDKPAKE